METVKIKHKEYQITQIISDDKYIGSYKDKKYLLRKFDYSSEEGKALLYNIKKLINNGVKVPKLIAVDKKAGFLVSEYIEGITAMEYLSKQDFSEDLFDQLFKINHMAKSGRMTLNYSPDKWIIREGELYYVYPWFINYNPKEELSEKYLRLYFNTKELAEFLDKNGVFYDKSRIKDEYSTNKEMVLMTVKYYR